MAPEGIPSRLARIEERSESLLREIKRLGREVETFGPLAGQLIELVAEIGSLAEDVGELKKDVKQQGMSMTLKIALVGGCFTLLAAIATAIAQIVSS